jgi:signal transduction histidine kinase
VAQRLVSRSARPDELGSLALAALQDMNSDAVVITIKPERPRIVALAGVPASSSERIVGELQMLERSLGETRIAEATLRDACRIEDFTMATTASVEVDGRRVGAIHLLQRAPTSRIDRGLLLAIASHAGVAVAGLGRRPSELAAPPEEAILALDRLTLTATNDEDLIAGIDAALAIVVGDVRSGVMVWDRDRDVLQMVPGSFGADERTAASYQISTLNRFSNAARVFATGASYLSNHATGDPAIIQDWVEAFDIARVISVRLDRPDGPLGVLHLLGAAGDLTIGDVWRVERLAPQIAAVVESLHQIFVLRRQLRLESILTEVAVAIASARSVHEFLTPALDELCEALEASVVALVLTADAPIIWRAADVSAAKEAELLAAASEQPDLRAELAGPIRPGDPGSFALHVPVILSGQRIGTLSVLRMRAEPFSSEEGNALSRLADLAALAWAAERYQLQRAELARIAERQRIADDLHDDVAQILFGAQIALDATLALPDLSEDAARNIVKARALMIRSDEVIRAVISELSRQSDDDFANRLTQLAGELQLEFDLPVRIEIDSAAGDPVRALRKPIREILLRVAQEALVNAAKHAGPCLAVVRVHIDRRGRIALEVLDDGIGASPSTTSPRHGLTALRRIVRTHGGTLRVSSPRTGGTRVVVSFEA